MKKLRVVCALVLAAAMVLGACASGDDAEGEPEPEPDSVGQPDSDTDSEPDEDPDSAQTVYDGNWQLMLVNPWHAIPEGYTVDPVDLSNGEQVDRRILADLQQMMDDCRSQGYDPMVCSGYRTHDLQIYLFENEAARYTAQGYSQSDAYLEASRALAVPGTSEHECGLAVDIVDASYQVLDDAQADTPAQQWLMAHAWEYGFVLRFPADKTDLTGIQYEPWHYRYVGRENAKSMHQQGVCLEEYLGQTTHGERITY